MIPKRLLASALKLVGTQTVSYEKFIGRTTGRGGIDTFTFETAVQLKGNFQPLEEKLYEVKGLDFNKKYFTFYSLTKFIEIDRDMSSDKITFGGETYQILDKNDWYDVNGWEGVLCVRL